MISTKNVVSKFLSSSITFTQAPSSKSAPGHPGTPQVQPTYQQKELVRLKQKKDLLNKPLDRQINKLQEQEEKKKPLHGKPQEQLRQAAPIPTTVTTPGQPQKTELTPQQLRVVKNTISDESLAQNVMPLVRVSNLANKIILEQDTSASLDTLVKSRLGGTLKTGFLGLIYEDGAWGVMAKR